MEETRILVVEDEIHLAYSLEYNLRADGYEVQTAPTLAAAQAAITDSEGRGFDLILLDVMLPDGDGMTYCRQLRDAGDRTPVLMLTAKGTRADIVNGFDSGADDYLTKPFALEELSSRIEALLRRRKWDRERAPQPTEALLFGPHRVDFRTHQVLAHGREIELTELELRLLKYFADRPREVISRSELLSKVWGVAPQSHTRTVDNFLVRLRRAFEADPSEPRHFLTVRGAGYQFDPDPGHAETAS